MAAVVVLAVVLVSGSEDGGSEPAPPRTVATAPPPAATEPALPPRAEPEGGLEIGVAEQNPHLIRPGEVPAAFAPWRDRLVAMRPRWFRLMIDWSRVQPSADAPPNWDAAGDGCLRGAQPCAPTGGVRDLLRAVRDRRAADGGWEIVASPYGAPDWARTPAAGCPAGGRIDLDAYRAMVRSLERVAREEGIPITWWSPWNEPNHPTFIAPQRAACGRDQPAISPGAYADLARAAREELPSRTGIVLGEVAGYDRPRRNAVGAAEFAAALPPDVACASSVWGQHTYVGRGSTSLAADRSRGGNPALLRAVERALDAHGCERPHRIWITETGAATDNGPGSCAAMDAALRAWQDDDRVEVAIQYTFREDTAFPVGLADATLTEERPAYRAWLAWGARDPRAGAPATPC